jgi:hypothetical protein
LNETGGQSMLPKTGELKALYEKAALIAIDVELD